MDNKFYGYPLCMLVQQLFATNPGVELKKSDIYNRLKPDGKLSFFDQINFKERIQKSLKILASINYITKKENKTAINTIYYSYQLNTSFSIDAKPDRQLKLF